MTSAGGMLIVGLGVKMLVDADIKVGNMLPSVFLPIVILPLYDWIAGFVAVM
jgi:hypothetical protein